MVSGDVRTLDANPVDALRSRLAVEPPSVRREWHVQRIRYRFTVAQMACFC